MRPFGIDLLAVCLTLMCVNAQDQKDKCPKRDLACLDIINSSQCLGQLVLDHREPLTKEAMIKCVVTEGSASNLTGAGKVRLEILVSAGNAELTASW